MSSRGNAILIASASAVFALAARPLTPFSYLGGAVIALVTLRLGCREGLLLLAAAALGTAVLGQLVLGQGLSAVLATLFLWVPAWLLAQILRSSGSLAVTMQVAALLGVMALFGVYLTYGDPAPWWQSVLEPVMEPMLEQSGITGAPEEWLRRISEMMTGILVGATMLGLIVTLYLARAWQAMLYNPGGFRSEFHSLRLKPALGWVTLGLVVLGQLGSGLAATLAMQIAAILLVLYFLAGLALVHGAVGLLGAHMGWLVVVYVLLLVVAPQTMLFLGLAGLTDSWLDFRGRLRKA